MTLKKILAFTLLLFSAVFIFGQSETVYPRGAILDQDAYNSLPRREADTSYAYEGLPRAFSLKQFAPLPGDQTEYGTCVAWAASYAARTITESIALNRTNQTETTRNAFSVAYVYRTIRPNDPHGYYGAQIHWALDMMTDTGAVKMNDIERSENYPLVELSLYQDSKRYPIAGYVTLFSQDDRYKPGLVTWTVKKSLAEGRPVIIGMNTPDSFFEAEGYWKPEEDPEIYYGGHAMCVVGYDDSRAGGSFEVLNSWGRKWGNGGYIWIPYNTFVNFVTEAYEIIENLAVYSDTVKFEGYARIELVGGDTSTASVALTQDGYYKTVETLSESTQMRLVVGASESAYVYVFKVSRLAQNNIFYSPMLMFPHTGVSALFNYSDSMLILPGEDKTLVIGSDAGTEFFIMLYSKQLLDIQDVLSRFDSGKGNLNERLLQAVGRNFLSIESENYSVVSYNENEAYFTAEPESFRAVAALIIAIEYISE